MFIRFLNHLVIFWTHIGKNITIKGTHCGSWCGCKQIRTNSRGLCCDIINKGKPWFYYTLEFL